MLFNYRNWIHYNAVLVFKKNSYSKNINQERMVQKSWFEHMLMIVKTLHNAYMQEMNKI